MSEWDLIECGYDAADETVNFGTRQLGDAENLYESYTVATIKSSADSEENEPPVINSVINNGKILFSVNNMFRIFEDLQCTSLCNEMVFEHIIDTFLVTSDGSILLCCLRNGEVMFLHLSDVITSLSSITVTADIESSSTCFLHCYLEMKHCNTRFLVVTRSGKCYRLTIEANNQSEEVHATCDIVTDFNQFLSTAAYNMQSLFVSESELRIYDIQEDKASSHCAVKYKKLLPLGNIMYLGLDDIGKLVRICSKTYWQTYIKTDQLFNDFTIIENLGTYSILAITKPNDDSISYIQLYNNPGFEIVFSLKLATDAELITLEDINDQLLYISKVTENNIISELRFTAVYETTPEKRLERLLRKGAFEEAEKFSKTYGLDINIVKKAKAQAIIDKSVCSKEDIDELLSMLTEINDAYFSMQSCQDVHMSCERAEDVKRVLSYGCADLSYNLMSDQLIMTIYEEVCAELFRFETFELIMNNGNTQYNIPEWTYFSGCDLVHEVTTKLRYHNIEDCVIIYSRLDNTALKNLNNASVEDILNVLSNISTTQRDEFLHIFIPTTLEYLPSSLPLFIKWLCDEIYEIEVKHPLHFPENAIKFCDTMVDLLKVQADVFNPTTAKELAEICTALNRIQELKNNYHIVVPLSDYLQGPRHFIKTLLSINMHEDDYDQFLQKFLHKFLLDNHFVPDEIFLSQIEDLVRYDEAYWISIVPSLLKCIGSAETAVKAVLIMLETASVPWSKELQKIAEESLVHSHILVEEVKQAIENHPRMVVLHKYNLKMDVGNALEMKRFISYIIRTNEPTLLEDIRQLCSTPQEHHSANLIFLKHSIKSGKLTEALSLLDGCSLEEAFHCCQELLSFIKTGINNDEYAMNCFKILTAIYNRLEKGNLDQGFAQYMKEDYSILYSTYKLKEEFEINLSSADLKECNNKRRILNELMQNLLIEHQENDADICESINKCRKISDYLNVPVDEILLEFSDKLGSFHVLLESAESIYNNSNNSRNLSLAAILIMQNVGASFSNMHQTMAALNETFMPQTINIVDTNIFIKGLQLAKKLSAKALLGAEQTDLSSCIEVLIWAETTCYMTVKKNKELFSDCFLNDFTIHSQDIFDCLKYIFSIFLNYNVQFPFPDLKYFSGYAFDRLPLSQDQLINAIKQLPHTIYTLCIEGQSLTAFQLIITLWSSLIHIKNNLNTEINDILSDIIIKQCLEQLLQQIVSAPFIDSNLLYNMLTVYDYKTAVSHIGKFISTYKMNINKLQTLAQVQLQIFKYHKMEECNTKYLNFILFKCKWWRKMNPTSIGINEFFKMAPQELVKALILNSNLTVMQLQDFARDYNLNIQKLYITYLQLTLQNWKPCYEIKNVVGGKRILLMQQNEEELLKICQSVITNLENTESVLTLVNSLWEQINFYHYEVFICMLKLCAPFGKTEGRNRNLVLSFLKQYNRVSKPSQTEVEHWYSAFPDTQALDPLSEWRLPFIQLLFTNDIWNIIRPEITLKTYKHWFNVIDTLALNKDDICCFAVKEVVSSKQLKQGDLNEWVAHPMHQNLFDEIEECIQNVTDLEKATSALYHLMSQTPNGADQVNAAKMCYKYALKYKQPGTPDIEKAFNKVHLKYISYSAMHILHLNQLADKKYLELVTQPNELIEALYMDERIIEAANGIVLHFPDINGAIDKLAELYECDITEMRMAFLKKWLSDSSDILDFSVTVEDENTDTTSKNLKRASYLCTSNNQEFWKGHLLAIGFNESSEDKKKYSYRAFALKCFCLINDSDTIQRMTNLTKNELIKLIQKLLLISELQYIGFSFDVTTLDACNKKEMLRRLAQNRLSGQCVRIMAQACITYEIYNLKYWEVIMQACIQLHMVNEIQEYLSFLKHTSASARKRFYLDSWQYVIDNLYKKCNSTGDLRSKYIENTKFLQTCPVLMSLTLDNVMDILLQNKATDFAAILLQYMPNLPKRQNYLKKIIDMDKNIIKNVGNLTRYGIWGVPVVKNMISNSE